MLLGLATGDRIGLGVVAGIFILFAVTSALLIPRYRPDFPGRAGLRLFILATLILFVSMMGAVNVFGQEEEGDEAAHAEGSGGEAAPRGETTGGQEKEPRPGGARRTVEVAGSEFEFELPGKSLSAGDYTFKLENTGQAAHDLVLEGPGLDDAATPLVDPGQTGSVDVTLASGTYKLYCSVPGHEDAGMKLELEIS